MQYNEENGITPTTIIKDVREVIEATTVAEKTAEYEAKKAVEENDVPVEVLIKKYEKEMKEAAKNLQFERAAELRDAINKLKEKM